MTPTDAIELAIEAGLDELHDGVFMLDAEEMRTFANLVEARVKERAALPDRETASELMRELEAQGVALDQNAWQAIVRSFACYRTAIRSME